MYTVTLGIMSYHNFAELAMSRYSARDFSNQPIEDKTLTAILQTAAQAPSWSNTRAYMLAIAQAERKDRIVQAYVQQCRIMLQAKNKTLSDDERERARQISEPNGDVPVMAPYPDLLKQRSAKLGLALYAHLGIDRHDFAARNAHMLRNFEAFGAPVIGFVLIRRDFLPFSALDAGIMLQTLFLAAKDQGVDSCPLGVLATWRSPLDNAFVIPEDYELVTGFALGYARKSHINQFRAEHPAIELAQPRPYHAIE